MKDNNSGTNEFEKNPAERPRGLVVEFAGFLVHSKKWWLTPIIVILFLVGLLVIVGGSEVAPFIYTLF